MKNEWKLRKLVEIAKENGWDHHDYLGIYNALGCGYLYGLTISLGSYEREYSVNDLVLDFEENEISFIQILYKELSKRNISYSNKPGCYVDESFRLDWVLLPTSKRLEFLFETFSHLL